MKAQRFLPHFLPIATEQNHEYIRRIDTTVQATFGDKYHQASTQNRFTMRLLVQISLYYPADRAEQKSWQDQQRLHPHKKHTPGNISTKDSSPTQEQILPFHLKNEKLINHEEKTIWRYLLARN